MVAAFLARHCGWAALLASMIMCFSCRCDAETAALNRSSGRLTQRDDILLQIKMPEVSRILKTDSEMVAETPCQNSQVRKSGRLNCSENRSVGETPDPHATHLDALTDKSVYNLKPDDVSSGAHSGIVYQRFEPQALTDSEGVEQPYGREPLPSSEDADMKSTANCNNGLGDSSCNKQNWVVFLKRCVLVAGCLGLVVCISLKCWWCCSASHDDFGFPIRSGIAYYRWKKNGRPALHADVERYGGWKQWLLRDIQLPGMNDTTYMEYLRCHRNRVRDAIFEDGTAIAREAAAGKKDLSRWTKQLEIAEAVEKDLPRTCAGHVLEDKLQASMRDVLNAVCGARVLSMGYAQGMTFVAALLSCIMSDEDAFWSLTGILEHAVPHLFEGGGSNGVEVDSRVIAWLVERARPNLATRLRCCEGCTADIFFVRPLVSLLARDLPADSVLQLWHRVLHAEWPRLELLRILAALVRVAEADIVELESDAYVHDIQVALRHRWESIYVIGCIVDILEEHSVSMGDEEVLQKIREVEAGVMQRSIFICWKKAAVRSEVLRIRWLKCLKGILSRRPTLLTGCRGKWQGTMTCDDMYACKKT